MGFFFCYGSVRSKIFDGIFMRSLKVHQPPLSFQFFFLLLVFSISFLSFFSRCFSGSLISPLERPGTTVSPRCSVLLERPGHFLWVFLQGLPCQRRAEACSFSVALGPCDPAGPSLPGWPPPPHNFLGPMSFFDGSFPVFSW